MKELALQWWKKASDEDKKYYSEIHYQLPFSQLTDDEIEYIFIQDVVEKQEKFSNDIAKYLLKYEGKDYYTDIVLAIQFGFELCENY